MTKDEFRNEYIKIDNQLRLLKSKYVQEFIEKWGIVFDKLMKIITNHGFTQSEWKGYTDIMHDVAFYHADNKTFWRGEREIENVTKLAYLNIISQLQGETQKPNFIERYNDITKSEWFKETYEDKSVSEENVEPTPKFKVGDWIIYGEIVTMRIVNVEDSYYEVEYTDGGKTFPNMDHVDKNSHLWTIDDAKEGDVIAIGNEYFLFKEKNNNTSPTVYISHCFCNSAKAFRVTNGRDCGEFFPVENGSRVHPATKEQRDTLFAKMKEAGYEWDAKNKKLIEINSRQTEVKDTTKLITPELLEEINSRQTEVKDTTKLITPELLEKNGFEFSHERCEGFECYSLIKFKGNVDIDLMHYENPNTDWLLTIMFNDCEDELVKVISTVDELQQCIDVMNLELKIKV
ncbi:MAG: hypothetical protein J5767_12525 [Paludibacteraceae bacterium]|nr:hypothetical protein [Paludibacteraceae bacterium]